MEIQQVIMWCTGCLILGIAYGRITPYGHKLGCAIVGVLIIIIAYKWHDVCRWMGLENDDEDQSSKTS